MKYQLADNFINSMGMREILMQKLSMFKSTNRKLNGGNDDSPVE